LQPSFLKVVAVAPAAVTRKGQVRAEGSPCAHATLGPLEDWLDARAGAGVIDAPAGIKQLLRAWGESDGMVLRFTRLAG
jgi:hypothetical protein